jgi:hypothetical protein
MDIEGATIQLDSQCSVFEEVLNFNFSVHKLPRFWVWKTDFQGGITYNLLHFIQFKATTTNFPLYFTSS